MTVPATNCGVDIQRIEFHAVTDASRTFGGEQSRPAAEEGIKNYIAAIRTVEDRIGDHGYWLHGRMQSEEIAFFAFLAEIDHAGIIPNVGSIAAKLPKLDVVPMRSFAMLEHEDQFVLAAIERTHSSVALHPDTEVLQLRVNLLACG